MRQVGEHTLWLGHVGDARDMRALGAAGIEAVVDLALNESPVRLNREMVYCRFPLIDGDGNPPWMIRAAVETVARLIRFEVRTLLFCSAGMSRTPAVAAAAIATVSGRTLEEELALVVQDGPVDLMPAFWKEVLNAMADPEI